MDIQRLPERWSNALARIGDRIPSLVATVWRRRATRAASPVEVAELDEVSQAKLRDYVHVALVICAFIAHRVDPQISFESVIFTSIASFVSAFALHMWALALQAGTISEHWRRYQRFACVVSDNSFISLVLYIGGESLAAVWALYIWISVGYGVRYGVQYLRWNVLVSLISFTAAAYLTPFWRYHLGFAIGLALAMAVVPLYVSWLITRLHTAVEQREIAYKAKSDFVARMSHELRTPLHAIIATTELLKTSKTKENQDELLNVIGVSSTTLLDLINKVLDLSHFESTTVSLAPVPMNVHTVVSEVATIVWPEAQRKRIGLRAFSDPRISMSLAGPSEQIKEILLNLLGNAAKFTDHGAITLAATLDLETDSYAQLRFVISDTGPGIDSAVLPTIFEPFVQADPSIKRRHGGSGLGTTFAKELARLMGGSISVSSEPGIGTTFELKLQLAKLTTSDNVHYAYPLNLVLLRRESPSGELLELLTSFKVRVHQVTTVTGLGSAIASESKDSRIHGVFVDADDFGDNLSGIVRAVSLAASNRSVPIVAFGGPDYRASAISVGFCSYFSDINEQIVGAALSTISAHSALVHQEQKGFLSVPVEASTPLRILAADDDSTNRMLIERILHEAGHKCVVVNNGEDALFELHDRHYDLAILDMHMPKRDGIEVAKIYRFSKFDASQQIPIILLTADSTLQARSEAESAAITRFLTKPIRPSDLVAAINEVHSQASKKSRTDPSVARKYDATNNRNVTPINSTRIPVASDTAVSYINEYSISDLLRFMTREEQRQFFSEFCVDADNYVCSLERVRAADDVVRAKNDLHALAGAAITIGAEHLAHCAKSIEGLASDEVLRNKQKLCRELRTHCDATLKQIKEQYIV